MDQLSEKLRGVVGEGRVLSEPDELLVYECDGLTQHKHRPRAVVFPASTEEVAAVVRVLSEAGVSFAPRGAGTGLSGGALALDRGVTIELSRMRRLLKVDIESRLAVVEVGMVNAQLSRLVAPHGLHYVPDPSSGATCTIGGNIAENAGGIHCLKYGTTTDHVLGVRVVLPNGEIVDLGGAGAPDAPGYDLRGFFIGSEGTLGIATEATVRLVPLPPAVRTLLADFADVDAASRAVSAIIAAGLVPAALEMLDGAAIRAVEASVFAAGLPPDAGAALLIELDGLEAGLDEEAARAEGVCRAHGARAVRRAADEAERKKLWAARKGAFGAMGRISPDLMLQDAVVPRSRLPEVLADIYRAGVKYQLRVANVFHAGDGNLHPFICFDARDRDEVRRVEEAGREIMKACVAAGGTITGEHGVGLDKSAYMPLIFSEDDLAAMLLVRAAFDPAGLCNPGKIIPAPRGCGEKRAVAVTPRSETNGRPRAGELVVPASSAKAQHSYITATMASSAVRYAARPRQFEEVVGGGNVCADDGGTLIVAPATTEEAAEVLRLTARENLTVLPAGANGATLVGGVRLKDIDVVVSTRRLTRLVAHEPADLVATAEAGLALSALNAALLRAGQWLPLDPPDDGGATIGGVVAAGLSGAQAFGYGAPRQFVLGMKVALADGRAIKAGGGVVKNVAGYDMCKLFTSSRGTLGLITELTFKLRPRPAREATLVALGSHPTELIKAARSILNAQLLPVAVELLSPRLATSIAAAADDSTQALLVRFAGSEQAVEAQLNQSRLLLATDARVNVGEPADDASIWRGLAALAYRGDQCLIWRAGVRPGELPVLLGAIEEAASRAGTHINWHAGIADGRLRAFQQVEAGLVPLISMLEELRRQAQGWGGSLVVEQAPAELWQKFDPWGLGNPVVALMRRVKHQLDPEGRLAPGCFG